MYKILINIYLSIIKEIFLCFEYGECRISDSANVSFEAINGMGYLKKMVCVCVWEGVNLTYFVFVASVFFFKTIRLFV